MARKTALLPVVVFAARQRLESRIDIFDDYTEHGFEDAFLKFFSIFRKSAIAGSSRTLYLFQKRVPDPPGITEEKH